MPRESLKVFVLNMFERQLKLAEYAYASHICILGLLMDTMCFSPN